jgi:vitamin B12 transporter
MRCLLFSIIVSGLIPAPAASAQASPEEEPAPQEIILTHPQIVVVATRLPTPIDQVGRSVSLITEEQIEERQQRFLLDALSIVPGLSTTRTGGVGALSTVSLRGLPSSQTLVVVDGVVSNDPSSFGNGFNFGDFDASDIARIEVLRGAQSTLYGSNAIGGVIHVITKDGRDGLGGSGFIEGGSFGAGRGAATLYGGGDRLSGRVTLAGTRTGGFSAAEVAGGDDDGFRNLTASGKLGFRPTESLSLQGIVRFSDSRVEFDGGVGVDDPDNVSNTETLTLAGSANHAAWGGRLNNQVSIAYFRNARLDASDFPFEGTGTRLTLEHLGSVEVSKRATLAYGVEYEEQQSAVRQGFGGSQTIANTSGYGLAQLRPLKGVALNIGVRHDSNSDFADATTFSVSGAIQIRVLHALLRGSYAEGFRAPSVGELSFNPLLRPEESEGWDVGLSRGLLEGRLQLEAAYFNARIVNQIGFDLGLFTFLNIDAFDTRGVELALTARPLRSAPEALEIAASYTYTDAFDVTGDIAALNQPDHRFNAQIFWRPAQRLQLGAGVTWNGRETGSGGRELDAFTVVDVRAAYAISKRLELFARIENAFDSEHQDTFGFATAPLAGTGGLRARF